MTNMLQDKIEHIREEGNLHRKTLDATQVPVLRGWPLRVYLWWAKSKQYRGMVTLCLYTWAVLLWAPLRWVVTALLRPLDRYLTADRNARIVARLERVSKWLIDWVGVPVYAVAALCFCAHPKRVPWLRPWLAMPAVIIWLLLRTQEGRIFLLWTVGSVVALAGLIRLGGCISDRIRERQVQLEQDRMTAYLRRIFVILHPDLAHVDGEFEHWRDREGAHWNSYSSTVEHSARLIRRNKAANRIRQQAIVDLRRQHPAPKPTPAWIHNIGLGLVLVGAYVAAKKKRICPIIQVPSIAD